MKCEVCGKEVDLPYQCSFCGKSFCSEHRLPEAHQCVGLPQEPFWYQRQKIIKTTAPPETSRPAFTSPQKTRWKKPRIRNFFTSFKLWFPPFWIVVILLVYVEADNPVQFYQIVSDPIKYSLFAFAFMIGLLSGYKVFRKCDYNPKSDAGIFGLRLLSGGVFIASFFGLFFGLYLLLFAGFFTPYEQFRKSLATETLGVFFIALSFALMILSAYLSFKFRRRAGIIVYRG